MVQNVLQMGEVSRGCPAVDSERADEEVPEII